MRKEAPGFFDPAIAKAREIGLLSNPNEPEKFMTPEVTDYLRGGADLEREKRGFRREPFKRESRRKAADYVRALEKREGVNLDPAAKEVIIATTEHDDLVASGELPIDPRYPTAMHIPTGQVFGGGSDYEVILAGDKVEIRGMGGFTVSFPTEQSNLRPGTKVGYKIEPTRRPIGIGRIFGRG